MPDCSWKLAGIWFVYSLLEAWLGRTKFGSFLGLIFKPIIGKLSKKENEDGKTI